MFYIKMFLMLMLKSINLTNLSNFIFFNNFVKLFVVILLIKQYFKHIMFFFIIFLTKCYCILMCFVRL